MSLVIPEIQFDKHLLRASDLPSQGNKNTDEQVQLPVQ